MKIKASRLILILLLPFIAVGCYEEKVKEAVSNIKIGTTKTDLISITKELTFLKEQSVEIYPNHDEAEMRAALTNNKNYEAQHPKNLIDLLTFDGDIKVYSYLINKKKVYANPPTLRYLAVFYSQKGDSVIGWAQMRTSGDVDTIRDKF